MNVYFTSDTHYHHTNIIKYCERPFADIPSMHEGLVSAWNSAVADDDIVFHLGDYALPKHSQLDELRDMTLALKGLKFLIRGNHDKLSNDFLLSAGFKSIHDSINLGGVLLTHHPLHEALPRDSSILKLGSFDHVIHGHVHRRDVPNFDAHYNVAVDRNEFKPVPLEVAVPRHLHDGFLQDLKRIVV